MVTYQTSETRVNEITERVCAKMKGWSKEDVPCQFDDAGVAKSNCPRYVKVRAVAVPSEDNADTGSLADG